MTGSPGRRTGSKRHMERYEEVSTLFELTVAIVRQLWAIKIVGREGSECGWGKTCLGLGRVGEV